MARTTLFSDDRTIGVFRGFSKGGLEFRADLVISYRQDYRQMALHGQFLLVELDGEMEAVLGRIIAVSPSGRFNSHAGEEYGLRALARNRPVPEELREQHLQYRIDLRVLGVLRADGQSYVFAPSHRRLPHMGSKVAFPPDEVMRFIVRHGTEDAGARLGYFALGEFVYCGRQAIQLPPWAQPIEPRLEPRFDVAALVSRRSFVFARAGFGKSNLVKLLFAELYRQTPTVPKRGGRQVPVGTVIFDPDGEYFWPDDKGRPGLCDVPDLRERMVVFTPKSAPGGFYQSFVAGDIRLDIRRLPPKDVIGIVLSPDKQTQQNVRKLAGLGERAWRELVDEIHQNGNAADPDTLKRLLQLESSQEAELYAARANMTTIVRMLHDPSSQMLDILLAALTRGMICVVDISQMRGSAGLALSGIILRRIFDHNQAQFTAVEPRTIPVIAVVEEAQAVLGSKDVGGEGPYVSWVKEGRKYDLGAMLITQQPGAISGEILSQGDNWFVFHLLSERDLRSIHSANAHFSDDLLSSLLNEPIAGNGIYWSSVGGMSYPIPFRARLFEQEYAAMDPEGHMPGADLAAARLRREFAALVEPEAMPLHQAGGAPAIDTYEGDTVDDEDNRPDAFTSYRERALQAIVDDAELLGKIRRHGLPWREVIERLKRHLPEQLLDRESIAFNLVPEAMNRAFGPQDIGWKTDRRPSKSRPGRFTTYIVAA